MPQPYQYDVFLVHVRLHHVIYNNAYQNQRNILSILRRHHLYALVTVGPKSFKKREERVWRKNYDGISFNL